MIVNIPLLLLSLTALSHGDVSHLKAASNPGNSPRDGSLSFIPIMDPKVKDALIQTLLHDDTSGLTAIYGSPISGAGAGHDQNQQASNLQENFIDGNIGRNNALYGAPNAEDEDSNQVLGSSNNAPSFEQQQQQQNYRFPQEPQNYQQQQQFQPQPQQLRPQPQQLQPQQPSRNYLPAQQNQQQQPVPADFSYNTQSTVGISQTSLLPSAAPTPFPQQAVTSNDRTTPAFQNQYTEQTFSTNQQLIPSNVPAPQQNQDRNYLPPSRFSPQPSQNIPTQFAPQPNQYSPQPQVQYTPSPASSAPVQYTPQTSQNTFSQTTRQPPRPTTVQANTIFGQTVGPTASPAPAAPQPQSSPDRGYLPPGSARKAEQVRRPSSSGGQVTVTSERLVESAPSFNNAPAAPAQQRSSTQYSAPTTRPAPAQAPSFPAPVQPSASVQNNALSIGQNQQQQPQEQRPQQPIQPQQQVQQQPQQSPDIRGNALHADVARFAGLSRGSASVDAIIPAPLIASFSVQEKQQIQKFNWQDADDISLPGASLDSGYQIQQPSQPFGTPFQNQQPSKEVNQQQQQQYTPQPQQYTQQPQQQPSQQPQQYTPQPQQYTQQPQQYTQQPSQQPQQYTQQPSQQPQQYTQQPSQQPQQPNDGYHYQRGQRDIPFALFVARPGKSS